MREGDPMDAVTSPGRPSSQQDNTRFTAVNNASNGGGSTVVVGPNRSVQGPMASSPQANSPPEDWQDNNSADYPSHKRKRTPDATLPQQSSNLHSQRPIQPNPQTPRLQVLQAALMASPLQPTAIPESGAGAEEGTSSRHISMEPNLERETVGEEPKTEDAHVLDTSEISSQPHGQDGGELKKRKRQFANRTKTGCITCRRRKKKCDEGKPECTNCKRGGFVCEGYTNKIAWTKAPVKSAQPVSIQSKLDINPSASTSPSPATAASSSMLASGQLLLTADPHSTSNRSPQPRPLSLEKGFATSTPPPVTTHQPSLQTPTTQQQPHEFILPRTPTFVTSGPLIPSPRTASPGPSSVYGNGENMTEKQRMLSGLWYHASSPELVGERERCKQACYRLNNASMLYAPKAEQWRLFVETLRPGGQYEGMPGGIIDKVDIETPFHCSYGTNISLGEEVRIGPGCTIIDAAHVHIKARTILEGDVKIYTILRKQDPRKRQGAKGSETAKPVIIDEDCWIGGNVTILPGVTINQGAVIGAGSVVTKDIAPFTIAAGNPATILSGVYHNGMM